MCPWQTAWFFRMLYYMESGIVKHLQTKDLPEAVICPLNLGSKERQLRNSDLYTTYAVVVCGFSMAVAVFTLELLSTRTGWFVAADFSRHHQHRDHSAGVICEISAFGRPSKTMYPFSHRENMNAATSATRGAFDELPRSSRGFVVDACTDVALAHTSVPSSVFGRKSSLHRFQYWLISRRHYILLYTPLFYDFQRSRIRWFYKICVFLTSLSTRFRVKGLLANRYDKGWTMVASWLLSEQVVFPNDSWEKTAKKN